MATAKFKRRFFRKHVSPRTGITSFTTTVRVAGFASASKTFPTKAAAAEWAEATEELLRAQKQRVRRDVATLTVGDLLLEYVADAETQEQSRISLVEQHVGYWMGELGTVKTLDLNVLQLREARDKLMHGRKPGTVNRYFVTLRSAWNWGRAAGLVPSERQWPARLMLTEPPGRTRFLSDAEMGTLLKVAREHSATMYAAIVVAIATGLRRSELLRLDWADVDLERQILSVRFSKNDTPRQVHLTQAACDALKALQASQKVRAISGAVFLDKRGERLIATTLEGRWRKLRTAAGLQNFRFHDCRHTCASILAQNGATLLQIAEVLGHKTFSMTQRYSHLIQGAPLTAHAALDAKLSKQP